MSDQPRRRAFTIAEVLVVIALIVVLLGLLLPALSGVWKSGQLTKSSSNLRQIALWMQTYSSDNRDAIVPAYFDYSGVTNTPTIRSNASGGPPIGDAFVGSWTDVLWTSFSGGAVPGLDPGGAGPDYDYVFDSPDRFVFEGVPGYQSPFRSAAPNSRNSPGADPLNPPPPKPFFPTIGAAEEGLPGFFAANMTFDSTGLVHSGYYSNGEIRAPSRTMYLVDSYAGETIGDGPGPAMAPPFNVDGPSLGGPPAEVDFRYDDACLMLFLDSHVSPQQPWRDLADLQDNKRIKVTDVTTN